MWFLSDDEASTSSPGAAESKALRAVEDAGDNCIQINSAQARETNYYIILIVPSTPCEGMNPAVLTEEVVGAEDSPPSAQTARPPPPTKTKAAAGVSR